MRRGSSTVIALVGDVNTELLDRLSGPSNVAVFDPPATGADGAMEALARAGSQQTPYSIVPADPLAHLAAEWQKMWTPGVEHRFEERAGEAIAAWRRGSLELPDYYMVVLDAPVSQDEPKAGRPHKFEFHLGVLRSQRSTRVVEIVPSEPAETATAILHSLGSLRQGPWWPEVDVLVEAVRSFFPGRLAAGSDAP